MKIGDKVKITITEKELNEILKYNKDLKKQILQCYYQKEGVIVEELLSDKLRKENYYILDTNNDVCWKESELKLID
jgi:hypothetical protein